MTRSWNGSWPPSSVPAEPLVRPEQEIWERLGRWREAPLSCKELEQSYASDLSEGLRQALAERLALQGAEALEALLRLIETQGPKKELVSALGLIDHTRARDHLFGWLNDPEVDQAVLLRSLAIWAPRVKRAVIEQALQGPQMDLRLAALSLLAFQAPGLSADELLHLCSGALQDPRVEVVVATLRILQRRDDYAIVVAIARLASEESVPIVAETALAALGCIGTPASIQALVERDSHLRNPVLVRSLERQIQGQFRHLQDLAACIRTSQAEGRLSAERASQLLALISW